MAVKIFFCYAHKDKKWLTELKKHLTSFQKRGFIETWCDRDISAGTEWEPEINKRLNSSDIILLLISADFMASDYCYGREMKRALERHEAGEARVIPVYIRPIYSQYEPFSKLQALPSNGKPVTKWPLKDDAFVDITENIVDIIRDISIQEEHSKDNVSTGASILPTPHEAISAQKKALLILTGGRALPDILTLLYLQPQLVIVIAPQEGWSYQKIFMDIVHALPYCEVKLISNVNAYDIDTCMQACIEACLPYPQTEWNWIFTTSSATKIMSLAGYELAKQRRVPCLYVDTFNGKVISLVKEIEVDTQRFFCLSILDYMKSYGYSQTSYPSNFNYRSKIEKWYDIAQELVLSTETETILNLLRDVRAGERISFSPELKSSMLLSSLEKRGLLDIARQTSEHSITCSFASNESAQFISAGYWLTIYIWHELVKAGFADDCQWDCLVNNGQVRYEVDLALTYRTRLFIAECSTALNSFRRSDSLSKLDSYANLLGGSFVSKFFITSQSKSAGDNRLYNAFYEQAALRRIVVLTKEDLPNIAMILKNEMFRATYPNI